MYKRYVKLVLVVLLFIIIASCERKNENEFLPKSCRTYNQFMYLVSEDFYQILQTNKIKISSKRFGDSISQVKSIKISASAGSDIDLNGIQCFPYLNTLEISGAGIKDLSPLAELNRVEVLKIDQTNIFNLEPLRNMTKLKELTITNTATLQNLAGIENFKRLEYINLSNNGIVGIEELAELTRLQEINLNNNEIEALESLEVLPELLILKVENNLIDFNEVEEFQGFKALRELYAKSNRICKTKPLGTLESLVFLDISDNNLGNMILDTSCEIDKPDFTFLKEIPSLRTLLARSNGLDSLESIQDVDIKHLQELDFSDNLISSIEPLILNSSLKAGNLTSLSLNNNQIEDISNIDEITNLTTLNLNNNHIGINGETIEAVFELKKLIELDLSHNQILELPPIIEGDEIKLPTVEVLDFSHNRLQKINNLYGHDKLKQVILNNNEITEIKNSFSNMSNLERVVWFNSDTLESELNIITLIEKAFNNLPKISFFEAGILQFDFISRDLNIINSFNTLNQFTSIKLDNLGINSIDNDSFRLAEVTEVNLDNNHLSEIYWINNLPKLTKLSAGNNEIMIDELLIIENSNVKEINLNGNLITSVLFLNKFPSLEVVDLASNMVSLGEEIILNSNNLIGFQHLKEINLDYNNISVLNGISNLDSLTKLNLQGNPINKINGLVNLKNLSELSIDYSYNVSYINGLSNLGITDFEFNQLTSMELIITSNSLANNHFTHLNLSKKSFADSNFNFIKNLSYLLLLDLSYTNYNNIDTVKDLTNLEALNLAGNGISNITPLTKLVNLKLLILENNYISNINVLLNHNKLEYLSLQDNNLASIEVSSTTSYFDNMQNLTYLNLRGNSFTSLVGLNNLSSLNALYIPENLVTFNNTLNGTHNLTLLTNYNSSISTYLIYNNNVTINNSFNSEQFNYLQFPVGYNRLILNSFEHLHALDLSGTGYTNYDLDFIKGFKNLQCLDFYGNSTITEIKNLDLSNLVKLEYVNMFDSSIQNVVNSFNNSPKLTTVDFSYATVSVQDSFNNCGMTSVYLGSGVTNIDNSFNSETLKTYYFQSIYHRDLLTITDSFNYINKLFIRDSELKIDFINSFSEVKALHLLNTKIQDTENIINYHFIENFTKLELLGIENIILQDKYSFPLDLNKLTNLEQLELSNLVLYELDNIFVGNSKIKSISLLSMTIDTLQNSFNKNLNLGEITICNSTINTLSNSFSETGVTIIDLDNNYLTHINSSFNKNNQTNIIFRYNNYGQIRSSFNDNPNLSTEVVLDNISLVENSFNNNEQLTTIRFSNRDILNIINSLNNTSVADIIVYRKQDLHTLSGFNNTNITRIGIADFDNLQEISGFENVKLTDLSLEGSLLQDVSFLDNVDLSNLKYISIYEFTALTSSEIMNLVNRSQAKNLVLTGVSKDINGLNLNIINSLTYLEIYHNDLDLNAIVAKLATKTSTESLYVTRNVYNGLTTYFYNQISREEIEQKILTEEEKAYRNQLDTSKYDDDEIETMVSEYMDRYRLEALDRDVEQEMERLVDEKLKYFTTF